MDNETRMLLCEASAVSLVAHFVFRRYKIACLIAVLVAPLVYSVESALRLHLPPAKLSWLPMVYPFFMLYSLPCAVVVGLPFLAWRAYRKNKTAYR